MTKRNRQKQDKNTMRDALTTKRVGNKEVICVDNAVDYVKKQGYLVIKPRFAISTIYTLLFVLSILLFMSSVWAEPVTTIGNANLNLSYSLAEIGGIAYTPQCLDICHLPIAITIRGNLAPATMSVNDSILTNYFSKKINDAKYIKTEIKYLNIQNVSVQDYVKVCNPFTDIYKGIPHIEDNCTWAKSGIHYELRYGWENMPDNIIIKKNVPFYIDFVGYIKPSIENRFSGDIIPKLRIMGTDFSFSNLAWWDSNWNYKSSFNITARIINFTLITNMSLNFSDFRPLDSTETSVRSFWIENNSYGNYIIVHFADNGPGYVYYNNSAVASTSSLQSVYPDLVHYYPYDWGQTDFAGTKDLSCGDLIMPVSKIFGGFWVTANKNCDTGFTLTDQFTISFWINRTGAWSGGNIFMGTGLSTSGDVLIFIDNGITDTFQLGLRNATGFTYTFSGLVPQQTWTLLTFTRNATSQAVWTNAVLNETRVMPFTAGANTLDFFSLNNNYHALNYQVDDIRVYNRSLSSAEITALYTNFVKGTYVLGGQQGQATDTNYPIFYNYKDNNGTLINNGYATFNVSINNTNGTTLFQINNTNFTAYNYSGNVFNVTIYLNMNGSYSYNWISYGNGTSRNFNISNTRAYVIGYADLMYPLFSGEVITAVNKSYQFNITILNSNGTAGMEIDNINYSMVNLSSLFSVNFTNLTLGTGIHNYYYWSYGNGTEHNYNKTGIYSYEIKAIPVASVDVFFYLDMTTLQGVVIFIVALLIAILVLLFVHWELGALFLIFDGFIAVLNLDNIFIGIMIIISAIVLIFMKKDK
jgi:hypothetical protein